MFEKGVVPLAQEKLDGSGLRVLIVHTRWNTEIVDALVSGAVETLLGLRVKKENILVESVPGSFELPFACKSFIESSKTKVDAVIAVGVLIKGSTMHFEYICDAASHGVMRVGLDAGIPVIFGILTCLNEAQAKQRAGLTPDGHNHGIDWGQAAVEMALLKKRCSQ